MSAPDNIRELLELAAKAAGIVSVEGTDRVWVEDGEGGVAGPFKYFDGASYFYEWNPLDDDGDALRLAVDLHIDPHWSHLGYATALHVPLVATSTIRVTEYGADPYAATRRAIVLAAAEIGRSMP